VTRLLRVGLVLALLLAATPAVAAPARFSMDAIETELMCPICGTRLDLSHSPAAERIRAFVSAKRDAGWTKAQVKSALVDQFGRSILADTPRSGAGLWAWLVPVLVALAGVLAAVLAIVRFRRRDVEAAEEKVDGPLDPQLERRVEEALARLDGP